MENAGGNLSSAAPSSANKEPDSCASTFVAPKKHISTWNKPYQHDYSHNESTAEMPKPLLIPGKHGLKEVKLRKSKKPRSELGSAAAIHGEKIDEQPQEVNNTSEPQLEIGLHTEISASNRATIQHCDESEGVSVTTVPSVTQTSTFLMEDLLVYKTELIQKRAILPCSNQYQVFVVGGFDFNLKCINVNQTFFIRMIPKIFTDCSKILYTCSCKADELDLVTLTSQKTINTYEEFSSQVQYCLHVEAAHPLISKFLDDRGVSIEKLVEEELELDSNHVLEVPFCHGICIVADKDSFGTVVLKNGKLTCLNCRFGPTTCKHTTTLRCMAESNEICTTMVDQEAYSVLQPAMAYSRKPVSTLKIPYEMSDQHKSLCKEGFKLIEDNFVPTSPAHCCMNATTTCIRKDLPFFLRTKIATISVPLVTCGCGALIKYDGREDSILNMGAYCVSHFVYRRFLREFHFGRNSLYSSYMIYTALLEDSGYTDAKKELSYQKYRSGWDHFLSLLDIDFDAGFSCDYCLSNPEIILCDGTTVSFRRKFLDWEVFLQEEVKTKPKPVRGSRFQERVFLSNGKVRKWMDLFGNSTKTAPMPVAQYLELKCGIYSKPELLQFITAVTVFEGADVYCNALYKNLIGVMAKDSPISASIFPSDDCIATLKSAINGLEIKKNISHMKILTEDAPVLAEFLKECSEENFPLLMRPVLRILIDYSLKPFESVYVSQRLQQTLSNFDVNLEKVTHFPALKMLCGRQNYDADKNTRKNSSSCNKTFSGHPILLPGVFTLYCKHGICYGFQVMPSCESVDVPFTILTTRFRKMPSAVIYDHACALHAYCLNREPQLFKNTKFLIDRLHWKNHTGCAIGYCLDKYINYKNINSQINEQNNASLQKIKNSLSYMTQENFMLHCKLYLWLVNQSKKHNMPI